MVSGEGNLEDEVKSSFFFFANVFTKCIIASLLGGL